MRLGRGRQSLGVSAGIGVDTRSAGTVGCEWTRPQGRRAGARAAQSWPRPRAGRLWWRRRGRACRMPVSGWVSRLPGYRARMWRHAHAGRASPPAEAQKPRAYLTPAPTRRVLACWSRRQTLSDASTDRRRAPARLPLSSPTAPRRRLSLGTPRLPRPAAASAAPPMGPTPARAAPPTLPRGLSPRRSWRARTIARPWPAISVRRQASARTHIHRDRWKRSF